MLNSAASRLKPLTERATLVYQELFNSLPVIAGQVVYPQLPAFQLTYFLQQALMRHYHVTLQFKAAPQVAPMTVTGYLQQDVAGHLILKSPHLITIVTPALLRSIRRVAR
ncbi:hypothetical protein [Levilactobacillus suantsaii]|uniref:Uncharacterized protein n=1 Tax=Levilactobacillus suantsaii TaxID=2292255 RepID=A0A4Q0VKQ5_9LACO|nr:hypothetical protein [Levilactobacillus suantsaii]QMU07768.1 hypothetical protein H3M12_09910 [Levilactobacillus suantsaii]RXI79396.1 hypothetical protein DXH47_03180 [Levilactobacillus suantsaii]